MDDENMNQRGGATDAHNKLESSRTSTARAAENLQSAATGMAEDYRGKAERVWDDAKKRVGTLQEDGQDYVRTNPMKAVLAALGAGLVLGLIFRR